ncbi:MAG: hypothetical protein KKF46_03755 [Nanoarchaeota archaeon]|nr:hypothetical protein [Nanoarchaeota archaeon]MBU1321449.1 hypothetical protein [Nanoarchaeota archaeon]MBU1596905.1 hypothetical protein [Nanoarchaeota archaeon]MBU2441558.1 hypothetical protein [Nanoarchaeota archaeon]
MLKYFILLILAFLGVFAGLLISYFAKEELKAGKIYFNIFRHILFVVILVLFFLKNWSILLVLVVALLIIIFSFSKYRETLYYYALAVVFFLSWKYNGFALIAPLIFLYGLPIGGIYLQDHFKDIKKVKKIIGGLFKQYIGFFIVGLVLGIIGLFL